MVPFEERKPAVVNVRDDCGGLDVRTRKDACNLTTTRQVELSGESSNFVVIVSGSHAYSTAAITVLLAPNLFPCNSKYNSNNK